jgi:hypothetical protein
MKLGRWLAPALAVTVAAPVAAQYQSPQRVEFRTATPYGNVGPYRFNVYHGPYQLQLMGEPGQPTIDAFCVDFEHTVQSSWNANIVDMSGNLSGTRQYSLYGGNETMTRARYQAAAWLAQQMMLAPTDQWWSYHGAIWYVMSGPTLTSSDNFYQPFQNLSLSRRGTVRDLAMAALNTGYATVNADEWAVITPTNMSYSSSSQEFITRTPGNVVPEPASVVLLGSGLLVLGFMAFRRSGSLA